MVSEALDALSAPIAAVFRAGTQEWSETIGNEMLALGVDVPAGLVFPVAGQAIAYTVGGIGLLAARAMIPALTGRPGHDALEFAGHFFNRAIALALHPVTAAQFAADMTNLRTGIQTGNADLIRQALVRDLAAVQTAIQTLWTNLLAIIGAPAGGVAAVRIVPSVGAVGGRVITGVTAVPAFAGQAQGVVY